MNRPVAMKAMLFQVNYKNIQLILFCMVRHFLGKPFFLLVLLLAATGTSLMGQVSISGPSCVIPGLTYQYIVSGTTNVTTQLCVSGGRFIAGDSCVSGSNLSTVFLVWSDSGTHRLELTSPAGNARLAATVTTELNGGQMQESDRERLFDSTMTSYTFHCVAASGGGCQASYAYQWQRSENNLNWIDIPGATELNYTYTGRLLVNTYFRRVTIELNSQTIGYSDNGLLSVMINN